MLQSIKTIAYAWGRSMRPRTIGSGTASAGSPPGSIVRRRRSTGCWSGWGHARARSSPRPTRGAARLPPPRMPWPAWRSPPRSAHAGSGRCAIWASATIRPGPRKKAGSSSTWTRRRPGRWQRPMTRTRSSGSSRVLRPASSKPTGCCATT